MSDLLQNDINYSHYLFEKNVAFFAYTSQVEGTIPVYRFVNPTLGIHFFTTSEEEKLSLENDPLYNSEGTAYYVLPIE
ncbi:MAG: hypothetical protein AB4372_05120 [Xenococcus sp. (in: cyanobacteria)]